MYGTARLLCFCDETMPGVIERIYPGVGCHFGGVRLWNISIDCVDYVVKMLVS